MPIGSTPLKSALSGHTVPKRDRIVILLSLAGVTGLAWTLLFRSAALTMEAPPGFEMMRIRPWTPLDLLNTFVMWTIMMVGMMLPSATPTTMIYAAVRTKASREGNSIAPTATFVSGYLTVWTLFSMAATLAQWGLDRGALLSPMMVASSPALGASLLIAAGLYQLTPAKKSCLTHCRSPAQFISEHWRPGVAGAFRMGLEHGVFCVGCCWLIMGLLFVGGVMNLLWVAIIAGFVLLERLVPGQFSVRFLAAGLIAAGIAFLLKQ